MYIYPLTDCFVLSELFGVARQARFPKLGSKPIDRLTDRYRQIDRHFIILFYYMS